MPSTAHFTPDQRTQVVSALVDRAKMTPADAQTLTSLIDREGQRLQDVALLWAQEGVFPIAPAISGYAPRDVAKKLAALGDSDPPAVLDALLILSQDYIAGKLLIDGRRRNVNQSP